MMGMINEFADVVAGRAVYIFNKEGHLVPMFFCLTKNGDISIMPIDMSDKDVTAFVMKAITTKMNPIAVIVVTEAWIKAFKNRPTSSDLAIPIKEQEGSREIITISLETKKYTKWMIIEIPEDRKVVKGKWEEMAGSNGRFMNLLEKEPPEEMYI